MRKFNRDSKFGRRDSGRFGRRDSNRSSRPEMHEVTCDKCGKSCEVPFRPTEGKPIYCSDCFRTEGKSMSRNKPDQSAKEFDQINGKLDKILKALKIE